MSAYFRRLPSVLLACVLLWWPEIGFATVIPLDEAGFTAALAKSLQAALPGYKITVRSPLTLNMEASDGKLGQGLLDTIYDFCKRNPRDCDAAVENHVAKISASLTREAIVDPSLLRAIVRPSGYLDTIRKAFAGSGEPPIAPLIGDLWVIGVVDMPDTFRSLAPADLVRLGLNSKEALALAIRNDAALLTPVEQAGRPVINEHTGLVSTSDYESSRLLLPESWAVLAARYGGQLLVAAPSTTVMIYADARQPEALQTMRKLAGTIAQQANRQLSQTIFRWTPVGWVVAGQ